MGRENSRFPNASVLKADGVGLTAIGRLRKRGLGGGGGGVKGNQVGSLVVCRADVLRQSEN